MNIEKSIRFDLLDGLRGMAAIAVMIYHYAQHSQLPWLQGAWISVDLFFVLSGFVIAFNYADKIIHGMGFIKFAALRLIRLYPLYLIGLLLGVLAAVIPDWVHGTMAMDLNIMGWLLLKGMFWLPHMGGGSVFPLNNPAWSLFFEIFVNFLFFAWIAVSKNKPQWIVVVFLFGGYILWSFVFRRINPGWSAENFFHGFPRVIGEFFLGCLIYSLKIYKKPPMYAGFAVCALIAFTLFFSGNHEISYLNSILILPCLVATASTISLSERGVKLCKVLGDFSYPVYVIHFPLMLVAEKCIDFHRYPASFQVWSVMAICLLLAGLTIDWDVKIRRRLVKYLH